MNRFKICISAVTFAFLTVTIYSCDSNTGKQTNETATPSNATNAQTSTPTKAARKHSAQMYNEGFSYGEQCQDNGTTCSVKTAWQIYNCYTDDTHPINPDWAQGWSDGFSKIPNQTDAHPENYE
jgi:hypothetical protein